MTPTLSRAGHPLALILAAGTLFLSVPAQAQPAGDCPAVLTVSGAIGESNRGAMDPFWDPLFDRFGIDFDRAMAFCFTDLETLPQTSLTARHDGWPGPITATGPTVASLLEAVGAAPDSALVVTAFDGYRWEVPGDIDTSTAILAIAADGAPLAIGGRGPVWLFAAPGVLGEGPDMGDAALVWSAMHVAVED